MNNKQVVHKHGQPSLPLCAGSASSGELTHRAMLLEVGEPQFDRLATEPVKTFGFRRGHPRSVVLDQRLVFASPNSSAAVRIGTARDLPGARPTVLRGTTVTMHHVDLPVALPSFLPADPRQRMASLHLGADRYLQLTSLHKLPKCREVNYFATMPPLPRKLDCLFTPGETEPKYHFLFLPAPFRGRGWLISSQ
jgi:hypothetical protein